ncbi:type II toxin-antitoxin system RelE/ParE family toxin [Variovorax sp. WS11]|uniref:type II toxin-antitoxin system RelE/ParE family toxin n=1 Tax=Variovorax sp. WS11 TaxID=1105204 RepID=UPI000D0CAF43|nr:type II toxin-antitoxin system RelE/ParE family toxin [Variovorax sp. WS11]NDZ18131.1 type II toxin-antitoxin system RelE/ParE family toxin [Variovorax sp. WS11]PSL79924.1 type II toxin-antitoxin system RelE/ParE family toxin [Variovorax sp. WS11]
MSGRGVRLELAPEVLHDFDRFFDHMAQFDGTDGPGWIEEIVQSLQILTLSPLIGRPVKGGKRESVIGHGSRGYVALYRFMADLDTVFVLAIRSQRERGFKRRR